MISTLILITPNKPIETGGFTTRFEYPITENWTQERRLGQGIETLKQCCTVRTLFSIRHSRSINIKEPREGTLLFEVVDRSKSDIRIQQITVMETRMEIQAKEDICSLKMKRKPQSSSHWNQIKKGMFGMPAS